MGDAIDRGNRRKAVFCQKSRDPNGHGSRFGKR